MNQILQKAKETGKENRAAGRGRTGMNGGNQVSPWRRALSRLLSIPMLSVQFRALLYVVNHTFPYPSFSAPHFDSWIMCSYNKLVCNGYVFFVVSKSFKKY